MTIHEVAGQAFTHQYLWNCASLLLSQPETDSPSDGYFRMSGMVMAYFTYEAYLNLIGPHIDHEAWKKRENSSAEHRIEEPKGSLIGYAISLE
jgi:hypothetical protein